MPFEFLEPGNLSDDQLRLRLLRTETAGESVWKAPTYRFDIQLVEKDQRIGHLNFRIGDSLLCTHYAGQIGYGIDEAHRGHHYAERACRLVLPFVARHGVHSLWITCNTDNTASRRTLERLGAELVEIVTVPDDYPFGSGTLRQKCRYLVKMMKYER